MMEEMVYKTARENMISICLQINEGHKGIRAENVKRWYVDADIARSKGWPAPAQPAPPEPELYVDAPPEGTIQDAIVIKFGGPVSDPTPLVLAEIPSYLLGRYPPNVTAISGITSNGTVLTCFPEDTRPTGWKETYKGLIGIKVEGMNPFGRVSFYGVVGPA
jgi:hypothetical protein